MFKVLGMTTILLASGFALGQTAVKLSEKFQKKLEAADATFQQAVSKAENAKFYAVQKATADRVKVLKLAMTEATKSGDLDAANEIKARIATAEAAGGTRAKPKDVIKFGGHEYALIEEKATWHTAKRICEEMGGHLATLETADELARIPEIAKVAKVNVWFGASDELVEGSWIWLTGPKVQFDFRRDNSGDSEHYLGLYGGSWEDLGDARFYFVCEWEN